MKNISKILTASAICASLALGFASCRPDTAPEITTETTTGTTTEATKDSDATSSETTVETTTEDTTTEATETTSEASEDTEGPAGNGPDTTDASSEAPASAPAKITVASADDVNVDKDKSDHVSISTEEPITTLVFSTDVTVKEFKILNLEITDYDEENGIQYKYETAFIQEALTPDRSLVCDLTFAGDLPTLGFSYIDTDGNLKIFSIGISGEDGSVVVSEI